MNPKVCFVLLNGTISLPFDAEDPFTSNNVLVGRVRDINPSSGTFEGVDLLAAILTSLCRIVLL